MSEALPEAIPAATLILMREREEGPPEILITERAQTMAFAAGALVFPGGRIDAADHDAAAQLAPDLHDGAARIAAIRETIEETGVPASLRPAPDQGMVAHLQERLNAGDSFADLLAQHALVLDLHALTPFARWCPNFRETRRFDTLFYLAEAPAGAHLATSDCNEAVRTFWATAAQVIADLEAGRAHAIFPTRRNLERLARFASLAEARADAALHPVRKITPWVEERDGQRFVCIPQDAGYPVTAEPFESARRR